jgi:hypothetical protein
MTYAEFLAENGATPDEIKILDVPAARKAFDKQQAAVAAAAETQRKAAETIEANRKWAEQVEAQNQTYLKERDSATVETAAYKARMAKMQELGLIEIAEKMEPGSVTPKQGETPAFDPKTLEKYVDRDTLMAVAEREGDAIAIAQDIAFEHRQLFPDKPLNFRELRREALARRGADGRPMSVEAHWEEKYDVRAARAAAAAKAQSDREAKIAADAVAKYKSENSTTNPFTAPAAASRTPFTGRVPSAPGAATGGDQRQPWQKSDAEREQSRLSKVMTHLSESGIVN